MPGRRAMRVDPARRDAYPLDMHNMHIDLSPQYAGFFIGATMSLNDLENNAQAKLKDFENKQQAWVSANLKPLLIGFVVCVFLAIALYGLGIF